MSMHVNQSRGGTRAMVGVATTALVTGLGLMWSASPALATPTPVTLTYDQPGEYQLTVPAGVTTMTITATGGEGGPSGDVLPYGTGGLGATVTGTVTVSAGQALSFTVGSKGGYGADVGFGGGGPGGAGSGISPFPGGAGGGASVVEQVGTTILVAGGGGGGSPFAINGGGSAQAGGQDGDTISGTAGQPGTVNEGGTGGTGGDAAGFGGCDEQFNGSDGTAGSSFQGGPGGAGATGAGLGGGGGGGGYFGGGGGGGSAWCSRGSVGSGGGGAGGSSYVDETVSDPTVTQANHSGDGSVVLTFVDGAGPVAAPTISPEPNASGWLDTYTFQIDWHWTDVGAGVDDQNCTKTSTVFPVLDEGANELGASCADNVGNASEDQVTVHIDTAPPVSGTEFAPTHEVDGWRRAPVSVHWNWSDATSGVDPGDCPQLSTFRHQGTHNVFTTCYDIAGNSNQAGAEVKVDASSPKIRIKRPLHHRYVRGAVVRAKYRCTDTGSGIARCHGTVASGHRIKTGRLGVHHFTVRAKDRLGHVTRRTVTYRVVSHG